MIITNVEPASWRELQNRVSEVLEQCGFVSEIEKKAKTARGTVELDVYAVEIVKGRKYSIACECKYWKSNIPQTVIHGFRTVVNDLGCNIGYVITTSDFQSGSINTSEFTNIELLTWVDFQELFFESWFENYFSPQITEKLDPLLTYTEPILPKWFKNMSQEDKEVYFELKDKYDVFGYIVMSFTTYSSLLRKSKTPLLPFHDRVKENKEVINRVPSEILNETGYMEFLDKCLDFGAKAISEFRQLRDKYGGTSNDE